jgi:hypothetical protein
MKKNFSQDKIKIGQKNFGQDKIKKNLDLVAALVFSIWTCLGLWELAKTSKSQNSRPSQRPTN